MAEIAQKSEKKAKVRGRPIQKGQVLNPGGRPKIPEEFKQLAKENSLVALQKVIEILNNPKSKNSERLKAAEIIMDRAWGKPTQSTEISGPGGGPIETAHSIDLSMLSDEELATIEAILTKKPGNTE